VGELTGEGEMLDQVQIIKDRDEARFAVIPYEEYLFLRDLLNDQEKLGDYLDYLHMQQVKAESPVRHTLEEVKRMLDVE
jgi:hypothetical protein